jgi:hypothetical protein
MALVDVALATDCIMSLLAERCSHKLFAIELRLKAEDVREIGARMMPKNVVDLVNGAGEGIRTLDPDLGKVVLYP